MTFEQQCLLRHVAGFDRGKQIPSGEGVRIWDMPEIPPLIAFRPSRLCRLAVVALAFGFAGYLSYGVSGIVGLVLGIRALRLIQTSWGDLRGEGVAISAIIASSGAILTGPYLFYLTRSLFVSNQEETLLETCITNQRQVARAFLMYSSDNEGTLPPGAAWCDAAGPYLMSLDSLHCIHLGAHESSYAMNGYLSSMPLNRLESPGEVVLLFDSIPGWNLFGNDSLAVARHKEGLVIARADGHVHWTLPADLNVRTWKPNQ